MYGEIPRKYISIMLEGSLLPPVKPMEYANISDRYLMIWLEFLFNEDNKSNQFFNEYEEIKVSMYRIIY